jgi:hypothetical protein
MRRPPKHHSRDANQFEFGQLCINYVGNAVPGPHLGPQTLIAHYLSVSNELVTNGSVGAQGWAPFALHSRAQPSNASNEIRRTLRPARKYVFAEGLDDSGQFVPRFNTGALFTAHLLLLEFRKSQIGFNAAYGFLTRHLCDAKVNWVT